MGRRDTESEQSRLLGAAMLSRLQPGYLAQRGVSSPARRPPPRSDHRPHNWTLPGPRRLLTILALLVTLIVADGAPATGQEASPIAGHNRAGLIVRHDDGRLTYALVSFAEEEISGIDVLEQSTIPLVIVGFGALGEGVCSLAGEGCPAAECRRRVCQGTGRDAPYWQVFRQAAPGDWRATGLGASAMRVRDGDVVGWSWTGRDPGLPAATIDDVARLAGAPSGAAGAEDGLPSPAVRTVYPPGVEPPTESEGQSALTYLAAGGVLVVIGGAGAYAVRRSRGRPALEESAA